MSDGIAISGAYAFQLLLDYFGAVLAVRGWRQLRLFPTQEQSQRDYGCGNASDKADGGPGQDDSDSFHGSVLVCLSGVQSVVSQRSLASPQGALQDPDLEWMILDSLLIRTHQPTINL